MKGRALGPCLFPNDIWKKQSHEFVQMPSAQIYNGEIVQLPTAQLGRNDGCRADCFCHLLHAQITLWY